MSNHHYVEILGRAGKIDRSPWQGDPCMTNSQLINTLKRGLEPGDILLFKRNNGDGIAGILSWLLRQLDKCWDGWGWHMGYVYDVFTDGSIIVAEAKIGNGVQLVKHQGINSLGEVRIYRWVDGFDLSVLKNFTLEHLGCAYDLACYFWTGMQLLIRRFSGRYIPRIINNRYTCWELVCDMTQAMGKPLQPTLRYPLITDMIKVLNGVRIV